MKKMTEGEIKNLLVKAFHDAAMATEEYLAKYPDNWFPCGFAWVVLDGRSPVTKVLKATYAVPQRGDKGYPKGWHIWNPAGHSTQCMDAKMAGARAFAKVITDAGFDCYADGRMD